MSGERSLTVGQSGWASDGACVVPADADAELRVTVWAWFDEPTMGRTVGERVERLRRVRSICAVCPVLEECRAFGMTQEFGFYGGLTAEERVARRRGDDRAHEQIMAEVRRTEQAQRRARELRAAGCSGGERRVLAAG